jgi:hypothetical protein
MIDLFSVSCSTSDKFHYVNQMLRGGRKALNDWGLRRETRGVGGIVRGEYIHETSSTRI